MYRAAGFREKYCCKEYFLFRNLKDILFDQFRKRLLLQIEEDSSSDLKIRDDFTREVRSIFLRIFGSTWYMDMFISLQYYYDEGAFIRVSLKRATDTPNFLWIDYSNSLQKIFLLITWKQYIFQQGGV